MFDFGLGATELMVIAVVALLVVGPKDLPRLLRTIGNVVAKVRGLAREFQGHLDEAMKETGIDEIKDNVTKMKEFSVADLDEEFAELEKQFHETGKFDDDEKDGGKGSGKDGKGGESSDDDDDVDDDGDLLDETERPIASLDGDGEAAAPAAVKTGKAAKKNGAAKGKSASKKGGKGSAGTRAAAARAGSAKPGGGKAKSAKSTRAARGKSARASGKSARASGKGAGKKSGRKS